MFGNNPFLTKKDPLLEAVQGAMQDGEIRRQAEALVNEEFGVYSRKAVVREQLAAYDARLEEAYKCMKEGDVENIMNPNSNWAKKQAADKNNPFNEPTPDPTKVAPNIMMKGAGGDGTRTMADKVKSLFKEGKWEGSKEDKDEDKKLAKKHGMTMKQWEKSAADKKHDAKEKMDEAKLAKKDYDKDGKVESPKDEVWGSRLRAAKMAGKLKEEEQIDEVSKKTLGSYIDKSMERVDSRKEAKGMRMKGRTLAVTKLGHGLKGIHKEPKVMAKEETDYSAQDRAPVTKSAPKEDPSTPKEYPGAASSLTAGNPTSQRMQNAVKSKLQEAIARKKDIAKGGVTAPQEYKEPRHPNPGALTSVQGMQSIAEEDIDEAAYSAKAARAGKDIGKPGKMFKKIAKKAGERYGSEERGKKVAGAILAKIRAKHMKEDQGF